jgi:hypothetical protein
VLAKSPKAKNIVREILGFRQFFTALTAEILVYRQFLTALGQQQECDKQEYYIHSNE